MASDAAIFKEPGVAKAELGDKQLCPSCGAKFYDLGKRPAVCPKCSAAFDPTDEAVRLKRVRTRPPAYEEDEAPKAAKEADDDEAAEEEEETVELDEAAVADPVEGTLDEDEEEGPANSDEIPAGFSEDVGDEEEEAADDDAVPILEDEEEEFPEDEIEIGSDEEDPPS